MPMRYGKKCWLHAAPWRAPRIAEESLDIPLARIVHVEGDADESFSNTGWRNES